MEINIFMDLVTSCVIVSDMNNELDSPHVQSVGHHGGLIAVSEKTPPIAAPTDADVDLEVLRSVKERQFFMNDDTGCRVPKRRDESEHMSRIDEALRVISDEEFSAIQDPDHGPIQATRSGQSG